jgi:hypothetical protein
LGSVTISAQIDWSLGFLPIDGLRQNRRCVLLRWVAKGQLWLLSSFLHIGRSSLLTHDLLDQV